MGIDFQQGWRFHLPLLSVLSIAFFLFLYSSTFFFENLSANGLFWRMFFSEDCVLDAVSTPTTMLNEPCQNNPLLIQAQAKIAQNKERAAPMIPSLIEYGWTENQTSELAAIKAPTGISFGSIDSLLGDGGSSWFTHKNVENSVINEHVEKGHLNIISDWKNGVRDMLRLFDMKDIPDFIRILDRGCDVCPLVKPEVMIECSYNSTDYAFPQLGESAPPFRY